MHWLVGAHAHGKQPLRSYVSQPNAQAMSHEPAVVTLDALASDTPLGSCGALGIRRTARRAIGRRVTGRGIATAVEDAAVTRAAVDYARVPRARVESPENEPSQAPARAGDLR